MNSRNAARSPRGIRSWLVGQGIRIVDLAVELGVDPSLVAHTIRGQKNNRRVLRALRDKGCPLEFLALPPDLRGREAA
jgi:hypothetical protein